MTRPASADVDGTYVTCTFRNPALARSCRAEASVCPMRLGRGAASGPDETKIVIGVSFRLLHLRVDQFE